MSNTKKTDILFTLIVQDRVSMVSMGSSGTLTDEQTERVEALAKEIQAIFGEQAVEE